jgi:GTPase SAR1 family protein
MSTARPPQQPASGPALDAQIKTAVDNGVAHLRRMDPDVAGDIDALRRQGAAQPAIVVVGETKRGKSSLINALLQAPNLSPVDAAVATSAYLEFRHGEPGAVAHVPGSPAPVPLTLDDLRDWGTVLGALPDGYRPPRRIEVLHPAALLANLTVVDTPGVGGLDSSHAEIALDAVEQATALLFVVDASAPFSQPELDFLIEASKRVNLVVFVLTKTDAYPGWRTVLEDNRALLLAHAPRFASAAFFPVSARLAELADQLPAAEAAAEVRRESRIAELQAALQTQVAARAELLGQANVLRAVRSELVGVDQGIGERMRAADPDPATLQSLKDERAEFSQRKRKDARTWSLTLNTETRRARTDATGRLREQVQQTQEWFLNAIDKANADRIKALPYELDRALHAISLRISAELEHRFRTIGHRVLREVFTDQELTRVLSRLNARLRMEVNSRPRRDGSGADQTLVVTSAAGTAMMAGRGATIGATALVGSGGLAGSLLVPGLGIGLGLAAGAFMLYRRKVAGDRQQARVWLKEVLSEARASLNEEIAHRFTDLEFALTVALDEAVERRVEQLDAQIGQIDQALAEDKAVRNRKKDALKSDRDAVRGRISKLDEVLGQVRKATRITVDVPAG